MKAIIPVAGAGTRLRPLTYTQPKALIPVAGKPLLGFLIEQLKELGVDEFVFVIGYLGDKIEDYVKSKHPKLKAHFALQAHRSGLGHAIWSAKDFVKSNEEIIILLGDTIIEADFKHAMQSSVSSLSVKKVDDPRNFGVAEFDADGFITKVIEKPLFPKSNMAIVGFYRILESELLFESLGQLVSNPQLLKEEIHLTDAIQIMIDKGCQFRSFRAENWYDLGKREILLETNAMMLKKQGIATLKLPHFENTIIIQPVHIAVDTKISNSIIGPNVTIGENATIHYSILQNSIIGNFTRLDQVILQNSIIGSDALVKAATQSLNIGDNTEIDLSGAL